MGIDSLPFLTPEERQKQDEAAQLAEMLAFCEAEAAPPVELRECGPEVVGFEEAVVLFEATHSLETLLAVTDLTPDEAKNHPVREPARIALIEISKQFKKLQTETNITPEKLGELKIILDRFRSAVGIINDNKVRH